MSYLFLIFPLALLCLVVYNVYDALRKPLIRRYGQKFRIVKTVHSTTDSWNEKQILENRYRLEVYTLGIWMLYDWWQDPRVCENDIELIKQWREFRVKEKEANKTKEVIKEDTL